MELLGSVNKVDSKVISQISGVQKKRLDGSEYFQGTAQIRYIRNSVLLAF